MRVSNLRSALASLPGRVATTLAALALAATALLVPAAAALAEPALWVAHTPTTTVYLFGSVHMLKPTVVWKTAKLESALAASQELWLEVANFDDTAAVQPLVLQLGLDREHPLSTKLNDAQKAKLATVLTGLGLPPTAFEPLRPWLAGVSLSILPLQKAGYDPKSGVELALKTQALAKGLPVKGFETLEQQIHFFADMTPAEELAFFDESLDEGAEGLQMIDKLEAAWEAGDVAAVNQQMTKDMTPALYQLLLVKRNIGFADQIEARMKQPGTAFVAVGAGHLAGPDSVQAQLAKRGIKVDRLQ
jgi:uncharacterized protein YbaP (TraB family)